MDFQDDRFIQRSERGTRRLVWVALMGLIEELIGTSLLQLDRSYWAAKLKNETWVCEARLTHENGVFRNFDWSNDLVATSDVLKIKELWLLCPPGRHSPVGNTARLFIDEPGTAFQFKVGMVDSVISASYRSMQAHIIGKVTNKETGACDCFIWDPVQQGLLTPQTLIFDSIKKELVRNQDGSLAYAGKTSVYDFHSWKPGNLAHLGRLHFPTLGIRL